MVGYKCKTIEELCSDCKHKDYCNILDLIDYDGESYFCEEYEKEDLK